MIGSFFEGGGTAGGYHLKGGGKVAADATGNVGTLRSNIGGTIAYSKVSGDANITITTGGNISIAAALGGGVSQTAIARASSSNGRAIEAPITLTGKGAASLFGLSGELLATFFASNGVSPQWADLNDDYMPFDPPKVFAPVEAGFTTGYAKVSIGSSNFTPTIPRPLDGLYDGRTQVRPNPADIAKYLGPDNNFEFGEAVFPRAYSFTGGRNTVLRNVNIGNTRLTTTRSSKAFHLEAYRFDGVNDGDSFFAAGDGSAFTGSISSNGNGTSTLTVTQMASGFGQFIASAKIRDGAAVGAMIQPFGTAGTSGTGGTGTYIINGEYNVASQYMRVWSNDQPIVTAQGAIVLGLRGSNKNQWRIAGDASSGYNQRSISTISMTGANEITFTTSDPFPGSPPIVGQTVAIWGVTPQGGASPDANNEGFHQNGTVVSHDATTRTTVVSISAGNNAFARNKHPQGTTGSGGFAVARTSAAGEHGDPFQGSGTSPLGGARFGAATVRSNYMQTAILSTGPISPDYLVEFRKIDGAFDETLDPQDEGSEAGRIGTSGQQDSQRVFYGVFAKPRVGQNLNFFPSTNDGGVLKTAAFGGQTVPAQGFDRSNFKGIIYAADAPRRWGRMGMAFDHNGINAVGIKYSEDRTPTAADLAWTRLYTVAGNQVTTLNLSSDMEDNALLGMFDHLNTLPSGSYVTDLFVSGGTGLSKRFRTLSRELRRGSAMLPVGNFTGGLVATVELRVIAKVTISGTAMTVEDMFYGRLQDGAEIMGPGITAGTTIVSGATPNNGRSGVYTISNSHTIAAPITIRARSTVRMVTNFGVSVTPGTFAPASGAFTRTSEGHAPASGAGSNWANLQTLSAPAATDRVVVARINSRSTASRGSSPTVTIGGVPATRVCGVENTSGASNWTQSCIYQALVPTGNTGDVAVTFGGSMQAVGIAVDSIVGGLRSAVTGLLMIVDSATGRANTNIGASTTINKAAGGVILACMFFSSAPSSGRAESWIGADVGTTLGDDVAISTVIGGTTASPTVVPTGVSNNALTPIMEIATSGSGATAMAVCSFAPHA